MLIMRIVFFIIYLSISIGGFAQNDTSSIVPDSLTLGTVPHLPKKVAFFDKLPHGKLFNSTYIGAPLVIGGLIVKHQDKKFRKLRNDFCRSSTGHSTIIRSTRPPLSWSG